MLRDAKVWIRYICVWQNISNNDHVLTLEEAEVDELAGLAYKNLTRVDI